MILRHEDRLLMAPRVGDALVFDGTKQIATISPGTDGWRWGEDGTVWTLSGGRLRVLRWRTGKPQLVNIRTRGKPGDRYGSLAPGLPSEPPFRENNMPDWAAVWGDGKLVASVENNTLNNPITSIAARAAKALRIKIKINEARRLTLYRDRRCLGYFRLLTASDTTARSRSGRGYGGVGSMGYENTGNHEHLAFTADGKYLSWAIDDGTGVRLFVFEVPSV